MAAVVLFAMAACSSGGYSAETCKELSEKIQKKDSLTEKDYNVMIDQLVAIAKEMKKLEGDEENSSTREELMKNPEFQAMVGYGIGFSFFLEGSKSKLPEGSLKKFDAAKEELK